MCKTANMEVKTMTSYRAKLVLDGKVFLNIVKVVRGDARLSIDDDKTEIAYLTPDRVALTMVYIRPEDAYEYDVVEPVEVGTNLEVIAKRLQKKKVGKNDKIELRVYENKLVTEIQRQSGRISRLTFKLIDVPPEIPEIKLENLISKYRVKIALLGSQWERLISSFDGADALTFEAYPEKLVVLDSDETVDEEDEFPADTLIEYRMDANEPVKSAYGYIFLKEIKPLSKVADTVEIMYDIDMPILIKYNIGGIEAKTLIAPRA